MRSIPTLETLLTFQTQSIRDSIIPQTNLGRTDDP